MKPLMLFTFIALFLAACQKDPDQLVKPAAIPLPPEIANSIIPLAPDTLNRYIYILYNNNYIYDSLYNHLGHRAKGMIYKYTTEVFAFDNLNWLGADQDFQTGFTYGEIVSSYALTADLGAQKTIGTNKKASYTTGWYNVKENGRVYMQSLYTWVNTPVLIPDSLQLSWDGMPVKEIYRHTYAETITGEEIYLGHDTILAHRNEHTYFRCRQTEDAHIDTNLPAGIYRFKIKYSVKGGHTPIYLSYIYVAGNLIEIKTSKPRTP